MIRNFKKRAALVSTSLLALAACTAPQPASSQGTKKEVRFLHLSDMHAQLDTHWEYLPEDPDHFRRMGGFARIKTALQKKRTSAPGAVFTVDGGDTFQGSAVAAWTAGEAIVAPLNSLGIDVGTPGNWEVVYGPEAFRKLLHEVNYQVVCYNFHDTKTGKRIFAPAKIIEKDGVRVAFVGMTDPTTTTRQPPSEVVGLDSTRVAGFREFVQDLKKRERPDLVVLVDHTGLAPSVQLAREIPEFDIVLSGHTHERVYRPIVVGKTIVVEPGSMGSFVGQLDVTVQNGAVVASHYELVGIDEHQPEDPQLKRLISDTERPFRKRLDRVIGSTKTPLLRYDVLEGTMDDLVADAAREEMHAELGFTNGFRFSPPIAPGPITEADLWTMLPLETRIKSGNVTGRQLRNYLEDEMELVFARDPYALSGGWGPRPSGLEVEFHAQAPKGKRVRSIRVNGKPIDDSRSYVMSGCEREGEPQDIICRLHGAQAIRYAPATIHDALRTYIRKHSPLDYHRRNPVRADDLPSTLWSQYGALQKMWSLPGAGDAVEIPKK